jgi:hypothetical protein
MQTEKPLSKKPQPVGMLILLYTPLISKLIFDKCQDVMDGRNTKRAVALSSLISLASHAYDIFASSTIDKKRQMLGYVFSNLELEGEKLRFSLRTPFHLFADLASCPGQDSNLRPID